MNIVEQRFWGEPKLNKPKYLNNKTKVGTVSYLDVCKCPVYIFENYVYIHHRDWFSKRIGKEEALRIGLIDKYNKKFIYNDNFGSVALRNECIFRFDKNILCESFVENRIILIKEFAKMINVDYIDISSYPWENFFEQVLKLIMF